MIFEGRGNYRVIDQDQRIFHAEITGRLLSRRDPRGQGEQVLAANVDTLFIVTSANQDFNLNRIDRYMALALTGGVRPVIIVNKIELANEPRALLDAAAARFPEFDVHGTSVVESWNLECLDRYAQAGMTVAFEQCKSNKALQSEQRKKWAKMHVAHCARDRWRGR